MAVVAYVYGSPTPSENSCSLDARVFQPNSEFLLVGHFGSRFAPVQLSTLAAFANFVGLAQLRQQEFGFFEEPAESCLTFT